MHNGRFLRVSLEVFVASLLSLLVAALMPLSVWQTLGAGPSSLAILAFAAVIAGVIVLRNRPAAGKNISHVGSLEIVS